VILVVATQNAGKLREYRALLADPGLELRSLSEVGDAPDVAEIGDTYLINARAKAHALAAHCRLPALADDSGLEVDALGGAPGVRSARFASDAALPLHPSADAANRALLLERLRGVPDERRSARFRCVIVVAHPDGRELVAEGSCEGLIVQTARGSGGFGYDPVFLYPALQRTFAELTAAQKDRVSHRAQAVRRLRPALDRFHHQDTKTPRNT
jgi:XTP/dITP diphosphohydrolase